DIDGDGDRESCRRRDQSDLDAAGDQARLDLPGHLDGTERRDHARHGAEEAEQRRDVGYRRENYEAALQEAELDDTGRLDAVLDVLAGLAITQPEQSRVQDGGHRPGRLGSKLQRLIDPTLLHEG